MIGMVLLLNIRSCARRIVKPNKPKHRSLEQRKVYCRAMQGDRWLIPEKPQTPQRVSAKRFYFILFFIFLKNFFLMWPFLKSLLNLPQHCLCSMRCSLGHEACGILAPRPGVEPSPPALEGEVLNHWTARKVPAKRF